MKAEGLCGVSMETTRRRSPVPVGIIISISRPVDPTPATGPPADRWGCQREVARMLFSHREVQMDTALSLVPS